MRRFISRTFAVVVASALVPIGVSLATNSADASGTTNGRHHHGGQPTAFTAHVILSGSTLSHTYSPNGTGAPTTETLSDPDDITTLGGDIFTGFQNGVGPQGQASTDGNLDSTVVEFLPNGDPVAQWDVQGKTDGVTADPQTGLVMATVNEDAKSSLYTISPATGQVVHYAYNESLPHDGGTDAISVYRGQILISASAPGTTNNGVVPPRSPAVYSVVLDPTTDAAMVSPVFYDDDSATVANTDASIGSTTTLALTDPDSNEVVPRGARFGGDFVLDSQGDQEQIYVHNLGGRHQILSVLSLSQSIDDTAWPSDSGRLYATDSTNDAIDTITGPFTPNQPVVAATPCGADSAPMTCPGPGYSANYLASLDPSTGVVSPITTVGAAFTPEGGLLYLPWGNDRSS